MKVTFLVNNITLIAGTERAVSNLANSFAKKKNDVRIISLYSKEGSTFYDIDPNVEIIHLNLKLFTSLKGRILSYSKYIKVLNKYIKNDVDIVIGTNHALNCLLPLISARKTAKLIGCEHMDYWGTTKSTRFLRRQMYPKLDAVVVLTEDDQKQYAKHIPTIKRCIAIPNQYSFFPDEKADIRIKRVIAIGRLEMQKGFDIMLDDLNETLKSYEDWELTIFGEGSMKDILIKKIQDYGLKNVVIKSPTSKIKEEMLSSAFYLMTSRNEGLPMVLLEAKACGLPILSYDCPTGPRDLIKNENDGFLIELGNRNDLNSRFKQLVDNQELREEMAENARLNVQEYSPERVFKIWDNFLKLL